MDDGLECKEALEIGGNAESEGIVKSGGDKDGDGDGIETGAGAGAGAGLGGLKGKPGGGSCPLASVDVDPGEDAGIAAEAATGSEEEATAAEATIGSAGSAAGKAAGRAAGSIAGRVAGRAAVAGAKASGS